MPITYPQVRNEDETLAMVLGGRSIARFGDGEFKIASGGGCVSQDPDKELTRELVQILRVPRDSCIVGIPRLDIRSPKFANWKKYEYKYPKYLNPAKTYYSAFISRPDSAPWIWNAEFYRRIESLWRGQEIVLVAGSDRSLTVDFPAMKSAEHVLQITCARRDAYADINSIESAVRQTGRKTAILCCGPTATCLAWRLADRGVHAIDLGHIGMFWYNGEERPKWMRSALEKSLASGGQA
jgi:glycosyltransferase GT-like protein